MFYTSLILVDESMIQVKQKAQFISLIRFHIVETIYIYIYMVLPEDTFYEGVF